MNVILFSTWHEQTHESQKIPCFGSKYDYGIEYIHRLRLSYQPRKFIAKSKNSWIDTDEFAVFSVTMWLI